MKLSQVQVNIISTIVHHTLGCQCNSFSTYAVHKVVPTRLLISEKLNYFMTSLRGKNEVEVKFENSMHNYDATRVHWHHTLGCPCSIFGTYAVHKLVPIRILITEKCNYLLHRYEVKTRGLSAWQLRCLIVYATLMMSNCLWYTAKLIPNDLDLTFQCHPKSNVMG